MLKTKNRMPLLDSSPQRHEQEDSRHDMDQRDAFDCEQAAFARNENTKFAVGCAYPCFDVNSLGTSITHGGDNSNCNAKNIKMDVNIIDSTSQPPCDAVREENPAMTKRECNDKKWRADLHKMREKYRSVNLENKGSVARDHLAVERTFLAWLRTSLAFASIGVAITQLFRLNTINNNAFSTDKDSPLYLANEDTQRIRKVGKPLGTTFISISIVTLLLGFSRFFDSQHWIIHGKFPVGRASVILMTLITFTLMVTSLMVIIVLDPNK